MTHPRHPRFSIRQQPSPVISLDLCCLPSFTPLKVQNRYIPGVFLVKALNIPHVSLQVLTTQQEILELDLLNLLSSCEFTENVLRYGNEAEIMLVKPQMVSRLHNLNSHESQCEPEDNEVKERSHG